MSEEEIIKHIKTLNEITKKNNKKGIVVGLEISTDMADKLLNLIEKQDKMIDLMADRITELIEKVYDSKYNKKDVIDIFKNLAVNNLLKEDK